MKSQDIVVLLKLISMHQTFFSAKDVGDQVLFVHDEYEGWSEGDKVSEKAIHKDLAPVDIDKQFSVRALAFATGISKTQISLSLQRMEQVGLQKLDRKLKLPKTNSKALLEFLAYGIRYVFPAKKRELARGIATSIAAPVLKNKLMSAGELVPVWPNAEGKTKGLSIEPLHPNVDKAIGADPRMYAFLALTDAIRLGNPRERNLAIDMLARLFKVSL
jgi:hypothetical protein